jgi:ABC-2 type transport system ATP-binding protein
MLGQGENAAPRGTEPRPGTATPVIEVRDLTRRFGPTVAVDRVSLVVNKGEIFGFFGPNGAGKTTTIRLLCGLLAPTSGEAAVAGVDVRADPVGVRRNLAILPEEVSFYEKMTPAAYLAFFARMAGFPLTRTRERVEEVVRLAELEGFLDKRIAVLSHGQRQKVSVARVLLTDAPVMFLDEPFTGIDIVHRKALREHLRAYVSRGNTVFFTSHNLIEAEHVVDRFAFIDRGRLVTTGTARELRERYLTPSFALRVSDLALSHKVLSERLATHECAVRGEELFVTLVNKEDVPKVAALLGAAGVALMEMRQTGTMEEVFLSMRHQERGGLP